MKPGTKKALIETQCKDCRHFRPKTGECAFVLYANLYAAHEVVKDLDWYRKNRPENIELIEDCNVSPLKTEDSRIAEVLQFNQQ